MHKTLQRELNFILPSIRTEERGKNLVLHEVAAVDQAVATRLLKLHHYQLSNSAGEIAAFGNMIFTPELEDNHEHAASLESESAATSEGDVSARRDRSSLGSPPALNGGSRKLKVILGNDDLKFADKIFNGMLGNDNDKSGYAAFLYDFDDFLFMYRNNEIDAEETQEELEGDDHDHTLAEGASVDMRELAFAVEAVLPLAAETARKSKKKGKGKSAKSPRSAFLSELMSAVSSGDGQAAITAWDSGDVEAFRTAFAKVQAALAPKPKEDAEQTAEGASSDANDNTHKNRKHDPDFTATEEDDSADVEGETDTDTESDADASDETDDDTAVEDSDTDTEASEEDDDGDDEDDSEEDAAADTEEEDAPTASTESVVPVPSNQTTDE